MWVIKANSLKRDRVSRISTIKEQPRESLLFEGRVMVERWEEGKL